VSRPSILDLITEREAAATAAAERLREQIATLTDELTLAETELAELAITRTTLTRLTGQPDTTTPVDATLASTPYQHILAVFGTATGGMRAKDVCLALGAGVTAKDTEGMRAKLKRLVARHILTETEPGLFALTPAPSA
jgi:glycine cleavage system regulatory protein